MNKFIDKLSIWSYEYVTKRIGLKIKRQTWDNLVQFIKFGIVGLSNTLISYVIYLVALMLFQKYGFIPQFDYLVAQFIAFILSVLWSFYWNKRFVFCDHNVTIGKILISLIKTYISYAFTGLFLSTALSYLWVEICGIHKLIAPVINLLVSVPINFLLNKFWAFGEKT